MAVRSHWLLWLIAWGTHATAVTAEEIDYHRDVQPILTRYCAGCHNPQAAAEHGNFACDSAEALLRGTEAGPVIVGHDLQKSRLWLVLQPEAEVRMPPSDEPQLSEADVQILRQWLEQGAVVGADDSAKKSPTNSPTSALVGRAPKPITALAWAPHERLIAVGRFGHVDWMTPQWQWIGRLEFSAGKVQDVQFHPHRPHVLIATGEAGTSGEAQLWDMAQGRLVRRFGGHADLLYAARFSPDGKTVATAGYDRQILLWDIDQEKPLRALSGHHGAVFDLDFSPDGSLLASASADATVKIWHVASGERYDTLSQPLKEQLTVDISPDGQTVAAAGADNRIRLWQIVSREQPAINPLQIARYAHEQAVQKIRFSADGKSLVSLGADRLAKVWDARTLEPISAHAQPGDYAQALAVDPTQSQALIGTMDGAWQSISWQAPSSSHSPLPLTHSPPTPDVISNTSEAPNAARTEVEPNDGPEQAESVVLPVTIQGTIDRAAGGPDRDHWRFEARAGENWLFEVHAARQGSPLDSVVRILDPEGKPVPRVWLQAVRDSYFTFRGKDSTQTGDFRLHNWEEMRLNQYLYASGEVVRLFHYPRGPDSGFNVYPNMGSRHTYFDTTPVSHALNEPAYIVEAHPPGTPLPANGLPRFVVPFENDDESMRRWDADSLLFFTAPQDGTYIVQLEDARQFQGADYRYELRARRPKPDFVVQGIPQELKVPRGAGQGVTLTIERIDGFRGPVEFEIVGLPQEWEVTGPLTIEPDQFQARFMVRATDAATPLPSGTALTIKARANLQGEVREREVGAIRTIQLADPPPIGIELLGNVTNGSGAMPIIELPAGRTAVAKIRIDRRGAFAERVGFGGEDALANAPHGVFVANIGLNGVLITEAESEREVFLRAESWVTPQDRIVFVTADVAGSPTSQPVILRVVSGDIPHTDSQAKNE